MRLLVKNLSKKYGTGDSEIDALKNIDLEVEEGEFTSIIGTSGSGKTTLLNAMGGLDQPSEGRVLYDDIDIYGLKDYELSNLRLKKVGFVFQFFNLIPELTVYENMILPLVFSKKRIDDKHIESLATELDIKEKLNRYPSELSGGQQQRVAIARALVNEPELLLCDEPTGNLDKRMGLEVLSILKRINEGRNTTVLIVTHDAEIAANCRRIIRIADGVVEKHL